MRLLAVPGTTIRRAQSGLDRNELFEPLARRQLFLPCLLATAAQFFSLLRLLLAWGHAFLTISILNQASHFTAQLWL
jgi:hypothetical protein